MWGVVGCRGGPFSSPTWVVQAKISVAGIIVGRSLGSRGSRWVPVSQAAFQVGVNGAILAVRIESSMFNADMRYGKRVAEFCRAVVRWESLVTVVHGPGVVMLVPIWVVTGWGGSEEDRYG